MEYYSAIKKKGIMPFVATWMDTELIYEVKYVRQRKTNIIRYHLDMASRKMTQMILFAGW